MVWCGMAAAAAAQPASTATILANDNRRPAGTVMNGMLTVTLIAGRGEWHPEEADGPALEAAAFGEEDGSLLTPGPLLRATEGMDVIVRIKNTLPDSLTVHGLMRHPANDDVGLVVPTGEMREARFPVGAAGTYYYWATTGARTMNNRNAFESQLGGAFIVDPRGNADADRVFVMTEWDDSRIQADEVVNADTRRVFAINGQSWPHTERLDERVGRSVRWHIVNLTQSGHPMHLHGFYFSVRGVGTGLQYQTYGPADYRQVVTEDVRVGRTMQMVWTPERAGTWLLHCHLIPHVTPALRFWASSSTPPANESVHGSHDARTAMAGLVMGIRVTGSESASVPAARSTSAKQITLVMHRRAGYWRPEDAYGFALKTGEQEPGPEDVTVPGPLLVLTKDQPVEITLKNRLPEATAIHWHGIELESYYDGVPGWSGTSLSTTPAIDPGGRFVVRFTPPRAGTFIYHTHSHDSHQLASGLYGAIVVVDRGDVFDPTRDHVVVLGMDGTKDVQTYDRFPVIVNGSRTSAFTMKAGVPNRFRLINITSSFNGLNVSLMARNQPISWRVVAKDGATLPPNQQTVQPALRHLITVGETYDFVVEPLVPGIMWLEVRRENGEWVQQARVTIAR
jgi:FtsP/CotA-like multicopper oxidase with cupredoxin domain